MIYILFLFFYGFIDAQTADSINYIKEFQVDSIRVVGNEQTREYIILRELTFEIGDSLDSETLNYNRDRIYSLGLFNRVDLFPENSGERTNLIIKVEETWFIYPVPFFSLRDKDWDKFSFGFSLVWNNFSGRNETLRSLMAFGYDPAFSLSYFNPDITYKNDIFIDASVSYQNVNNKSENARLLHGNQFEQKFITAGLGVGKRIGLFNRISAMVGFNYVETPFFIKGISASDGRIDRIPLIGLTYQYDTRDLVQFPKEGMLFFSSVQFKGLSLNDINYQIINLDYRHYWMLIGDLGSKWRAAARLSAGNLIPYYDFSYLGFSERIRGYFNHEQEGHNSYLFSLEFNYPIIKEMNINLDFIPVIPKELLHYRVAFYTQLFTNTGTTKMKGIPLTLSDFNSGYGLGFTLLILPYNVLRVEYAFNEFFNGELIIDLGVSF